jgi:hypothetical protein
MTFIKQTVDRFIIPAIQRSKFLRILLYYLSERTDLYGYASYKNAFIRNGHGSRYDERLRAEIIRRFELIDQNVTISTTKAEGLILAEALLSLDTDSGDVVECGSFFGGSTAKLSIVAKITGRRLRVFDSFEGLPPHPPSAAEDYHFRENEQKWTEADYSGRLETVKKNIETYGEISTCSFFPGFFSETLSDKNMPDKIAFIFADVDLVPSAVECLAHLWPLLLPKGLYFTHDANFIKVVQSLCDPALWKKLNHHPPVLFGAGYGMGDAAPSLGFFVKGSVSPEYIKGLLFSKSACPIADPAVGKK